MKAGHTIATLILTAIFGCSSSFMSRNDPANILAQSKWESSSTQHFIFYYRPDSRSESRIDSIEICQEQNYIYILRLLEITDPDYRITVFIFPSLKDKINVTGNGGYAHSISDYGAVYCIDSDTLANVMGKHELTHLLWYRAFGDGDHGPFYWLITEGMAVYSDGKWGGADLDAFLRLRLKNDKISTPYDIVKSSAPSHSLRYAYPVAGAFIKYLIANQGLKKLIRLYEEGNSLKDFDRIYGEDFSAVSKRFVSSLMSPE